MQTCYAILHHKLLNHYGHSLCLHNPQILLFPFAILGHAYTNCRKLCC